MSKREAERLANESGARFLRHGASHDVWLTKNGDLLAIPRNRGDLTPGVERDIRRKLGL